MDKITQADREAAASLMSDVGLFSNVLTKKAVQAFARHRLAHTQQSETSVATDVAALVEAATAFQHYGCPVCSGDCGSANPPVTACPMQALSAALAPFTKGQTEQERKAWGGGTVMTQTLEQLSATADKDPLKHGMSFLAALETAYRTGQLVAVQPDDATVERMQEAYATFGQTGHLRTTPPSPSPKQP